MVKQILKGGYSIIKEKKLIIEVFDGSMTMENFKAFKIKQASDPDFDPTYNNISITDNLIINATINQIDTLVNFLANHAEIIGKRKSAVCVNSQNLLVYTSIYKSLQNKLPQEYQIFSNLSDALNWLDLSESFTEIQLHLNEIKDEHLQHFHDTLTY